MTHSPYKEIEDDGIEHVCFMCGLQIHGGKYPPVCDGYCRYWFDVEGQFNEWAKEQVK